MQQTFQSSNLPALNAFLALGTVESQSGHENQCEVTSHLTNTELCSELSLTLKVGVRKTCQVPPMNAQS